MYVVEFAFYFCTVHSTLLSDRCRMPSCFEVVVTGILALCHYDCWCIPYHVYIV